MDQTAEPDGRRGVTFVPVESPMRKKSLTGVRTGRFIAHAAQAYEDDESFRAEVLAHTLDLEHDSASLRSVHSSKNRIMYVTTQRLELFWLKAIEFLTCLKTSMWVAPLVAIIVNFIIGFLFSLVGAGGIQSESSNSTWFFNGTAEDAQAIFIFVGGLALNLTAIVFSLCIVAFQVAGVTYSSRMLTGLTGRISTKVVLSIFLGTFSYSYAGMQSAESSADASSVPSVAVNVLMIYVLAMVLGLVYYLHYVVTSMRVSRLLDIVSEETEKVIAKFHTPLGDVSCPVERRLSVSGELYDLDKIMSDHDTGGLPNVPAGAYKLHAMHGGHMLGITKHRLQKMTEYWGFTIRVRPTPDLYVQEGALLAWFWFWDREETADIYVGLLRAQMHSCFRFGPDRVVSHDIKSGLEQITEVALKALSPAVNDPGTAVEAIHRAERLLIRIATLRCEPCILRSKDSSAQVLVAIPRPRFKSLLDCVIFPFREYGKGDVKVTRELQLMLGTIGYAINHYMATLEKEGSTIRMLSRIALVENHMKNVLQLARETHRRENYEAILDGTKIAMARMSMGKDIDVQEMEFVTMQEMKAEKTWLREGQTNCEDGRGDVSPDSECN